MKTIGKKSFAVAVNEKLKDSKLLLTNVTLQTGSNVTHLEGKLIKTIGVRSFAI